jgi:hypothetical protein
MGDRIGGLGRIAVQASIGSRARCRRAESDVRGHLADVVKRRGDMAPVTADAGRDAQNRRAAALPTGRHLALRPAKDPPRGYTSYVCGAIPYSCTCIAAYQTIARGDLCLTRHGPATAACPALDISMPVGVELAYHPVRRDDGIHYAEQGVALARQLRDPALLGRTLNNYGLVTWGSPDGVRQRLPEMAVRSYRRRYAPESRC